MNKIKNLVCFLVFCHYHINAQSGLNCSDAVNLSYPITHSVNNYNNDYYWFKVNLNAGSFLISAINQNQSVKVLGATIYKGSNCGTLTYFGKIRYLVHRIQSKKN